MKKQELNIKKSNMKKAAVESIFVWMLIFASFVSVFFMTINYSVVLRVKDNVDTLAEYGANYVASNGIGDDLSLFLNDMAPSRVANINGDTNAICNSVADNTFQVIFNVTTTNDSFLFQNEPITSTRVSYNQVNSNTVTCDLEITLNDN